MNVYKTHRKVKKPQITGRYLADFMAASQRAQRGIAQKCKYQAIARVIQHNEAKLSISRHLREKTDGSELNAKISELRNRMADSDFDRDLLDHNADYIEMFISKRDKLILPDVDISPPGDRPQITLNGVKVSADIAFRLQRVTKTNKIRIGAAMLRYQKGKPLNEVVAEWQSAFLHGYMKNTWPIDEDTPEFKLCLTIDCYTGLATQAPTNSVSRFKNMEAACASIYERWDNIEPPKNAVF